MPLKKILLGSTAQAPYQFSITEQAIIVNEQFATAFFLIIHF